METIKIVLVGDGAVGKTALVNRFVDDTFPKGHLPTLYDNRTTNISWKDVEYTLLISDTAGQEEFDKLRPASYHDAHCILLVYSIGDLTSFRNLSQKWIPEIKHHCPDIPFILVGSKSDLRKDEGFATKLAEKGRSLLTEAEAKKTAKKLGAACYRECSALTGENVFLVLETAIQAVLDPADSFSVTNCSCTII